VAKRDVKQTATTARSKRVAEEFTRIEQSRLRRDELGRDWDEIEKLVRGDDFWNLDIERDLEVNISHATLQTAIPKVLLQNPKLVGRPKRRGSERSAKIVEKVDNYYIDELRMVPEWRKCVADAQVYGIGVLKVGYIPPDQTYPEVQEDADTDADQAAREIERLEAEVSSLDAEGATQASQAEADPEALIDPWKKRDYFFTQRVSPRSFLWDPMATDLREMRWVAHEYVMPVDSVHKERRFKERARNKVRGDKRFRESETRGGLRVQSAIHTSIDAPPHLSSETSDDAEFATLIEIWDWEQQKLITVAENGPEILQEVDWPYPIEGFPFSILRYNITPDEFVPLSDLIAAAPQAQELSYLRRKRSLHLRRFNRKYAVDPLQGEDDQAMDELSAGVDGGIVRISPNMVAPISDAPTSPDYDRHENAIRQDYREITAQSELERGTSLGSGGTATEAALLDANARLRSNYHRALTEEFIEDSFRILNALLRSFLDGGVVIEITGDEEAEDGWLEIRNQDIQGEFDVEVVAGSTLPITQESRKRSLLELFQILSPFMQAGAMPIAPILREIAEAYDIKDVEGFLGIPDEATQSQTPIGQPTPFPGPGASGVSQPGEQGAPQLDALAAAFGTQGGIGG
jgi:hypothetical protein